MDVIETIAAKENWDLRYVSGTWAECMKRLENGQIDLMPDVAYTEQRAGLYEFGEESVMSGWGQVYAQPGSNIRTFLDLEGKKIATLKASVYVDAFLELAGGFDVKCELVLTDDYLKAFEMLDAKSVDGLVVNRCFGSVHEGDYAVEKTPIIFFPNELRFAGPKGRGRDLLNMIDNHLIRMKEEKEGSYYQALDKWLGVSPEPLIPKWFKWALVAPTGAILLALGISLFLRQQIRVRTSELRAKTQSLEAEVAAHKATSAKLSESERKYRTLVEQTHDIIYAADAEGVLTFVSPQVSKLGYTPEQVIGRNLLDFVHPDDADRVSRDFQETMATGREFPTDLRLTAEDGSCIWTEECGRAVKEGDAIIGVVGILRDVTERRNAEVLRIEKQAAEAANQAKSDFLANMSHELRTPLNSVIGFAEVLEQQHFGTLNEKQTEYMRDIVDSGRHLLSLINDILDLSKVEAGKMEPEWSRINVEDVLSESLVLIREKCLKHRIQLAVNIEDTARGLEIVADERRLKQILYNLLSNAAKFTPGGGSIALSAAARDADLTVDVSDTGTGIAPKDQEKIFDEFYQVHGGSQDKTAGTGLGLSLVRQLVAMHGGRVWVESDGIGRGSTFSFTIPFNAAAAEEARRHTESRRISGEASLADAVADAIRSAKETGRPFTVCALKQDGRGGVTDLSRIEEILRTIKRDYDVVIPGEDLFSVIILLECSKADGRTVCSRFRERLCAALDTDVLCCIASFPDDGETAEALISTLRQDREDMG